MALPVPDRSHVIIAGFGVPGRFIAEALEFHNLPFCVIETNAAVAERWPLRSVLSLRERALYQARKLNEAAARSGGRLVVIKTADDLARFVERRRGYPQLVAGLLGIEGAYPLEGDVANVDVLFDAGFRMMAPTHFYDSDWGGEQGPLQPGTQCVHRVS